MYTPIYRRRWFWITVAIIAIPIIAFRIEVWYLATYRNIYLQVGGSLRPQVQDWISWSYELPLAPGERPQVGWMYSYRRPAFTAKTPIEKLKQQLGWRTATKWCWHVYDNRTWDTATDDGVVPDSAIIRRVVDIYDSRSNKLRKTREGRFILWVERYHLQGYYIWSKSGQFVAIQSGNDVLIYDRAGKLTNRFCNWTLAPSQTSMFLVWRQNDKWTRTLLAYWPESKKTVTPCDTAGRLLPPLNPEFHGKGFVAVGRLALLFAGHKWIVNPTGPHVQTSILTFNRPFSGLLRMSGGGDADIFVQIKVDGEETASLFGTWGAYEVALINTRQIVVEISRLVENNWSEGGIDTFVLWASSFP